MRRPNQPITIEQRQTVRDEGGGAAESWVSVRDDYAFVEDITLQERDEVGRIAPVAARRFTLRRDNSFDATNWRIVYNGEPYNVNPTEVADRNMRYNYMTLIGLTGVAQ
jgi:SPP1 family predicted phage head-tail adaptor